MSAPVVYCPECEHLWDYDIGPDPVGHFRGDGRGNYVPCPGTPIDLVAVYKKFRVYISQALGIMETVKAGDPPDLLWELVHDLCMETERE